MIYIITFIISCVVLHIGERYLNKSNKYIFFCCVGISIFMPAILAGVRDYTVGTDVLVYGNNVFLFCAKKNNLIDCINSTSIESGYIVLNYIVSRFTHNPHWFYFILNFIMNGLVIAGVNKYKRSNPEKNISMALMLFVYYMTFYNQSLNILRQALAMSVIVFLLNDLFEKKYIKYSIGCIIASTIHISALFCIAFMPIHMYINHKVSIRKFILIIVLSASCVAVYSVITDFFITQGWLPGKYVRYISQDNIKYIFKIDSLIVRFPIVYLMIISFKDMYKTNNNVPIFLLMLILEIVFMQLEVFVEFAARINSYIMLFRLFSFERVAIFKKKLPVYKLNNKRTLNYNVFKWIVITYLLVVWIYSIVILNNNKTYPYTSEILGI